MKKLWKVLYVFSRRSALTGLPGLRLLRNRIYDRYLGTHGSNVEDFVKIGTAHLNPAAPHIKIGTSLHLSRDVEIDISGGISIGERVTVSESAKIYTHGHDIDGQYDDWRLNALVFSHLTIEDDVWIGANAVVLESVNFIGRGAVVAAGAIVTKDVERLSVVGGNPARLIRYRKIREDSFQVAKQCCSDGMVSREI